MSARRFFPSVLAWLALAWMLVTQPLPAHATIRLSPSLSAPSVVETPHVRAELVVHAPDGLQPGVAAWLGLRLTHQPHWHTYWQNPGDSGLPTTLEWTLPDGLATDDIAWPVPQRLPVGPLVNYGYEGELLLPVPLAVLPGFDAAQESVTIGLQARWLVCRVECIPEEATLALQVPARSTQTLHAQAFETAWKRRPQPLPVAGSATVDGDALALRVDGLPAAVHGQPLGVFPQAPDVLHNAVVAEGEDTPHAQPAVRQQWDNGVWTVRWPLSPSRMDTPADLALTLVPLAKLTDQPAGWEVRLPIAGQWTAVERAEVSPALAAALEANAQAAANPPTAAPLMAPASTSLVLMLFGALAGGLLLNLMPCVFPVLAIKVLGLVDPQVPAAQRRGQGLAYTAGVVLAFLALAGLLLALRAGGQQLGWGFQLQSPTVVAALAALFTVIGLNLAGLFEFTLGMPQRLTQAQARHPLAEALWSGVLAVVVASPCTAPFMGASIGMALGLPAAGALAVFALLGLGMALPYALISTWPALARWLPRPGAWMQTLRQALAFPMFLTVAWLLWVLGQQSGIDGVAALLVVLVGLGALLWAWSLRGRARPWALGLTVAALAAALGMGGPAIVAPAAPVSAAPEASSASDWAPWSPQAVRQHLEAGRPVFIDFTAAWCVTCQFNKRTTLSDAAVLADLRQRQVVTLRADWTRQDPQITQALQQLGRSGVPVYVLQVPGRAPQLLPELLRPADVHAALAALQP